MDLCLGVVYCVCACAYAHKCVCVCLCVGVCVCVSTCVQVQADAREMSGSLLSLSVDPSSVLRNGAVCHAVKEDQGCGQRAWLR